MISREMEYFTAEKSFNINIQGRCFDTANTESGLGFV